MAVIQDLQSDLVYYTLRCLYSYENEYLDKDMASRMKQELVDLDRKYPNNIF